MAFEEIWESIRQHAGETFYQLGGKTFTYQADTESLTPSTDAVRIPRQEFERVYNMGEVAPPRKLKEMGVKEASLIFSILTDPRIGRS